MLLVSLLVIGALGFASWELLRRRASARDAGSADPGDPPPLVHSDKSDDDAGDGEGDGDA